jgi:hypothetical protein
MPTAMSAEFRSTPWIGNVIGRDKRFTTKSFTAITRPTLLKWRSRAILWTLGKWAFMLPKLKFQHFFDNEIVPKNMLLITMRSI